MFLPVSVKIMDFYDDPYCFPIYIKLLPFPICGFKIWSQMLHFNVMMLALLPLSAPPIIIKRLENEFDSCYLSLLDRLD